jgi:hypothetical protein
VSCSRSWSEIGVCHCVIEVLIGRQVRTWGLAGELAPGFRSGGVGELPPGHKERRDPRHRRRLCRDWREALECAAELRDVLDTVTGGPVGAHQLQVVHDYQPQPVVADRDLPAWRGAWKATGPGRRAGETTGSWATLSGQQARPVRRSPPRPDWRALRPRSRSALGPRRAGASGLERLPRPRGRAPGP